MPWITIEELSRGPLSRASWEKRLRQGEAESYVDELGQRWVWREPGRPALDLRKLGGTLARLQADLRALEQRRGEPSDVEARRELRAELSELGARLDGLEAASAGRGEDAPQGQAGAPRSARAPGSEPRAAAREPGRTLAFPRPDRAERLLELVANYPGSEREVEREAGLPKAFLAKAKKGERRGPRSAGSWDLLEAFFQARGRRAA